MATLRDYLNPNNGNQTPSSGGNITPERYIDLYNQIYGANPSNLPQNAYQDYSEDINAKVPQIRGWYENDPNAPVRQRNGITGALAGLSDWGESIMNPFGWDPNAGFTLPNIARFAGSIPFQMVGGLAETPAMFAEALTGSNILDRDAEGNPYAYNLTDEQRLSQFVNAGINVGGLAFGGSGKVLGAGAEILGAGTKLGPKLGKSLAEGTVSQFARNSVTDAFGSGKGARAAGVLAGTSVDAAEEAAEEFVQSHLDDSRWNSKDNESEERALNAAKWGALGGGIMGGAGHGVHSLWEYAQNEYKPSGSNAANPAAQLRSDQFDYNALKPTGDYSDFTKVATDAALDEMRQSRYTTGSSVLWGGAGEKIAFHEAKIGVLDIYGAFYSTIPGAKEDVASRFGLTPDEMDNILRDTKNRVSRLKEQAAKMDAAGTPVRIAFSKMPFGNNVGYMDFDITDVFEGSGIRTNKAIPSMMNSDTDGDKANVYWHFGGEDSDKLVRGGYALNQLIEAVSGNSIVDDSYTPFTAEASDELVDVVKELQKQIKSNELASAISAYTGYSHGGLVKLFDVANKAARDNAVAQGLDPDTATRSLSRAISDVEAKHSQLEKLSEAEVATVNKQTARARAQAYKYDETARELNDKGQLHESTFASIMAYLGYETSSRSIIGNSPFRINTEFYMWSHKRAELMLDGATQQEIDGIVHWATSWMMGPLVSGMEIVNNLSTARDIAVYGRMKLWLATHGNFITSDNVQEFFDEFKSRYNEQTGIVQDSLKRSHLKEGEEILEAVKNSSNLISKDANWQSPEMLRAFQDVFGFQEFGEMFGRDSENQFDDMTINQVVYYLMSEDPMSQVSRPQLRGLDRVFSGMIVSNEARSNRITSSYRSYIQELLDTNRQYNPNFDIFKRYREEGRKGDISDIDFVTWMIQSAQRVFGVGDCLEMGLGTVSGFLNSAWGKKFLESDNVDAMINAVVSFKMVAKYKKVLDELKLETPSSAKIIQELENISMSGSFLDAVILQDYKQNGGNTKFLTSLCSLDVSLDKKQQDFDIRTLAIGRHDDLLSNIVSSGDDLIGSSKVALEIAAAKQDLKHAARSSKQVITESWNQMKSMLADGEWSSNKSDFVDLMRLLFSQAASSISEDLLATHAYTQAYITKKGRDKAQVDDSSANISAALTNAYNGSPFSVISGITAQFGSMESSAFITNRVQLLWFLAGRTSSIDIFDKETGLRNTWTRSEFFKEIMPDNEDAQRMKDDGEITYSMYVDLFDKCPAILAYALPHTSSAFTTEEGATVITSGYNGNNIISTFKNLLQDNMWKDSNERAREEARQELFIKVCNDPRLLSMVYARAGKTLVKADSTLEDAQKAINNSIEQCMEFIIRASNLSEQDYASFNSDMFVGELNTVWNNASSLLKYVEDEAKSDIARFEANAVDLSTLSISTVFDNIASHIINMDIYQNGIDKSGRVKPNAGQTVNAINKALGNLYNSAVATTTSRYKDASDSLTKKIDDLMPLIERAFGRSMALIGRADMDQFLISSNEYARAISELRNEMQKILNNKRSTKKQLKSAQAVLDKIDESLNNIFGVGVSDSCFKPEDFTDLQALKDKLSKLENEYGNYDHNISKETIKLFDEVRDNKILIDDKKITNRCYLLNSYLLKSTVIQLHRTSANETYEADELALRIDTLRKFYDVIKDYRNTSKRQAIRSSKFSRDEIDSFFNGFAWEDPAIAMLRSSSETNLVGAPISAGIGINGQMMPLLGGLTIFNEDFLSDQFRIESQSASRENVSMYSSLIKRLTNWWQEPLFLQLKKVISSSGDMIGRVRIGESAADTNTTFSVDRAAAAADFAKTTHDKIEEIRDNFVDGLSKIIKQFDPTGQLAKSGFETEQMRALVTMMTPYITITIGEYTANGVKVPAQRIIVNTDRFFKGASGFDCLSDHPQSKNIIDAINNGAKNITYELNKVGLEELSFKVQRHLDRVFRTQRENYGSGSNNAQGSVIPKIELGKEAAIAALNWEMYNDPSNRMKASDLLSRVSYDSSAPISSAVPGIFETPGQIWGKAHYALLPQTIADARSFFEKNYEHRAWTDDMRDRVTSSAANFLRTELGRTFQSNISKHFGEATIVSITGQAKTGSSAFNTTEERNGIDALNHYPRPNEVGTGREEALPKLEIVGDDEALLISNTNRKLQAVVDVICGDNNNSVERVKDCIRMGRKFILDADAYQATRRDKELNIIQHNGSPERMANTLWYFYNVEYTAYRSIPSRAAWNLVENPDTQLTLGIASDRFFLGDSTTIQNVGTTLRTFLKKGLTRGLNLVNEAVIDPSDLFGPTYQNFDLVTDQSEILEIRLIMSDNDLRSKRVDFSYYAQFGRSYEFYRNNMWSFLNRYQNKAVPKTMTGVQIGDCIGIAKTRNRNGETVYAPIFYDGSRLKGGAEVTINRGEAAKNGLIVIQSKRKAINVKDTIKMAFLGRATKTEVTPFSDENGVWPSFYRPISSDRLGGTALLGYIEPDFITDKNNQKGRMVDASWRSFIETLYWCSRLPGIGGNLLCSKVKGEWKLKDDLSDQLEDSLKNNGGRFDMDTRDFLNDLIEGQDSAWIQIANGSRILFQNPGLNNTIRDLAIQVSRHSRIGMTAAIVFPNNVRINEDGSIRDIGLRVFRTDLGVFFSGFAASKNDILSLFNAITPGMFAPSIEASIAAIDSDTPSHNWHINHLGQIYVADKLKDGNPVGWCDVIVGPEVFSGDDSVSGNIGTQASLPFQGLQSQLMDFGIYDEETADLLRYYALTANIGIATQKDIDAIIKKRREQKRVANAMKAKGARPGSISLYERSADLSFGSNLSSMTSMQIYTNKAREALRGFVDRLEIVDSRDLSRASSEPSKLEYVQRVRDNFNDQLFGSESSERRRLSNQQIDQLVMAWYGFSKSDSFHGLTSNQYIEALNDIIKNVTENRPILPSGVFITDGGDLRLHVPMIPKGTVEALWQSEKIKSNYANLSSFKKSMEDKWKESRKAVTALADPGQQKIMRTILDAVWLDNNQTLSGVYLDRFDFEELLDLERRSWELGWSNLSPDAIELFDKVIKPQQERFIEKINAARLKRATWSEETEAGSMRIAKVAEDRVIVSIGDHLVALRQINGMLYPTMWAANVSERAVNQGAQSVTLDLAQRGIGPFGHLKSHMKNANGKTTRRASRNPELVQFWAALRTAEIHGLSNQLIGAIQTTGSVKQAIEKTMKENGVFEKYASMVTDVMSGKGIFMSKQIENFLDFCDLHLAERLPQYMLPANEDMTIFEQLLDDDPVSLVSKILFDDTSSVFGQQAMNWARRGDMAQRNLFSAVFAEIASRNKLVKFLVGTLVTPFFQYQTNRGIKILNWVAPMSTIMYVLTDAASKSDKVVPLTGGIKFSELGLETAQLNSSLREAMAADMMHLGPVLVAFMLLAMPGAVEPPDDEDKWCNFREWTILGQRLDVAWWIEDTLGLALPMLCWLTAAQMGKPRTDILVNGITDYLSANPAVKVADAVGVLFDPFNEFYQEYDDTQDAFMKALGGPPTMADMVMGKSTSFGLSYIAQFITPGFIKEIYNSSQEYERSWKRVYEENAAGMPTSDATEYGATMMTSYRDAIIRKQTRNNPVMGFMADIILNNNTGYMAHEMPKTVYYDPYQLDTMKRLSIYNDPANKADEKSDEEKTALAIYIVSQLQSHSVEELSAVGFILDVDTRKYVSEYLWDNIADLNRQWSEMNAAGLLDYRVAGDGDYDKGRELVEALRKQRNDTINYWKSLYYDKLWSDELTSLVRYNQKHTKWRQDANGNWYAAGYYPGWISPITFIPGESMTDGWQSVMSRENDWTAESAAIEGMSTGVRGLVPIPEDSLRVPSFESWSYDGTDTGYSESTVRSDPTKRDNPYGSTSSTTYRTGNYTTYPSTSSGYRRSSGGGGGGYSSAPDIYYRNNTPNTPNASTIRRTSRAKEDMDYLRPNFETKGSREAYKRGDI